MLSMLPVLWGEEKREWKFMTWNFLNSGKRETCRAFKRDYNNKNRFSVLCLGKKTNYIFLKMSKINRTEGPTFLMSGKVIKVW